MEINFLFLYGGKPQKEFTYNKYHKNLRKAAVVGQSRKQNYVKYIQRGSVQEERREDPAELGKDQEGQKRSALPLPPRQPDSLTGPEEAEGSPWGPSDRKDHVRCNQGQKHVRIVCDSMTDQLDNTTNAKGRDIINCDAADRGKG